MCDCLQNIRMGHRWTAKKPLKNDKKLKLENSWFQEPQRPPKAQTGCAVLRPDTSSLGYCEAPEFGVLSPSLVIHAG